MKGCTSCSAVHANPSCSPIGPARPWISSRRFRRGASGRRRGTLRTRLAASASNRRSTLAPPAKPTSQASACQIAYVPVLELAFGRRAGKQGDCGDHEAGADTG
jgi:hypothetical protein